MVAVSPYYIEQNGPTGVGGGMHHGGFPRMRTFHYGYDHTTGKFDCFSPTGRGPGVGGDLWPPLATRRAAAPTAR